MSMKIREFSMEDFAAVTQLWLRSKMKASLGDRRRDIALKLERDPDLFLVAEQDADIVGSIIGAWDGRRGWVYHLAVDPRFRRKRIASRMLREVEGRMREKGVLKVNAMVYLWNGPSLTLFEKLGYKKQDDIVMMGKALGGDRRVGSRRVVPSRRRNPS
jgi:ribosomal protein S18 acetylase RimI-like enzyme